MDWNEWIGKRIFVQLKSGSVYSGIVLDVDDSSPPIIFITIRDKFGMLVTIVHSEILRINEESQK